MGDATAEKYGRDNEPWKFAHAEFLQAGDLLSTAIIIRMTEKWRLGKTRRLPQAT